MLFKSAKDDRQVYRVVHPLHYLPEQKRSVDGLGLIKMSKGVKVSLIVLRAYLGLILGLAIYRIAVLMAHTG